MNRTKLFIENFFTYGIVSALTKIIPFVLLPIITRLLPDTSNYGHFSVYELVTNFGMSLSGLGIYAITFREYFDTKDTHQQDNLTTTTFWIIFLNTIFIFIALLIFSPVLNKVLFGDVNNIAIILLGGIGILVSAYFELFRFPIKLKNDRKVFTLAGISNSLLNKVVAIFLIVIGLSYFGLIWSAIISNSIIILYFWYKYRDFYFRGKFRWDIAKSLLKQGLPLIPISIIFWVYGSIDRVMILRFHDFADLGIYQIGASLSTVSSLIFVAFSTGWGYFAFKTMKDDDYKPMMGTVFSLLFVFCSLFYLSMFLLKDFLFNTMFTGDYVYGVIVFPYLLLPPLILIFNYVLVHQLIIIKKTFIISIFYALGCTLCICLNLWLTPIYGIVGAAIATASGYAFSLMITFILVVFIKKLIILDFKLYIMLFSFILLFVTINYFDVNSYTVGLIFIYIAMVFHLYYQKAIYFFKRWRSQ
jgi:O-antigen/teichoic acid export membrane protein